MGASGVVYDARLTTADRLVLQQLSAEITSTSAADDEASLKETISTLKAFNDPKDARFDPMVFTTIENDEIRSSALPGFLKRLFESYVSWGRHIVRVETDVVLLTHLFLYFSTSLPSAILLYFHFTYLHALCHIAMQGFYMGPYTLLKHQHIHGHGVLAKRFGVFDNFFPYVMDLLMGHTWNSYYFHHVKHHHVEGNGPNDLSSTIRYQRDSIRHFALYVGRFLVGVWFELPRYFFRTNKTALGFKCLACELGSYVLILAMYHLVSKPATVFVFVIPLVGMRLALMTGNWAQHAFVDEDEPDSDYRSSVTLVDVASNRLCFNDGYHTSHHLNPLRHWRDHPAAFLQGKHEYARQQALVFHDIDYLMVTIKLLSKDYVHLAKCLVPIGKEQIAMTLEERAAMLRRHTRAFTEEEIRKK
ncbi:fatty acid desaturase [Bombardia bombarda]|uniref:Fatty acid desaturase n=1 Tax=Bombardia bombarda TaxID=252184 RepID=A0AA39XC24_9PEZI|nr:fatty acid desaturase [Bombardia bombarda]